MKVYAGVSATAVIMAALLGSSARAQPATSGAGAATDVGEVIVTATRREESVGKISQSVTALNGKALQVRGVKSIDDVVRLTPGIELNANGFGTQAEISIRGISSPLVGAATTGIYIDDTPIQARNVGYSATNTYPLVFDLDRVEVLRGPQGTLFGAGAEGGAVRFITPAPSLDRYGAYVRSEVGSTQYGDPSYEFGAALGGPIIVDKIGFRASAWARRDGGYVDRVDQNPEITNPTVFKNTNWADTEVFSLALAFAPSERLRITPSVFFQDRWLNDIGTFWETASDPAAGRFINGQPLAQPDHDTFVLPALAIRYDFGPVSLISNTSFFQRKDSLVDDYSTLVPAIFALTNFIPGSPNYSAYAEMVNKQSVYNEELRLQSTNPKSRLTWVAGLFLSQSDQKSYETIVDPNFGDVTEYAYGLSVQDALGQPLINGVYSLWANGQGVDKQAALYGEASYRLFDALKLTAGVRVARTSFSGSSFGTGPFIGATIIQPKETTTETPVTPKFGVSWQADENNLFYATAAKGYRIGGANAPLSDFCAIGLQGYTTVPTIYQSDSVWSYEIGAKNRLFDRRLEIDTSAYHIDWSNIQQLVYVSNCGQQFVDNLGHATSNGFDVQLAAHPAPGLTLETSVGYTDATFSHTVNKNPGIAANIVTAGDHIETQPWSIELGATYQRRVFDNREAFIRIDYEYHSRSAVTPITDPANGGYDPSALPTPATNYLTLRSGLRWSGYDISVFVDNVLGATPELTRYSEVLGNPIHRDFTFRPRTIGLTASYRY
jgi:outer membrane receptor protein involved in Fe transport